MKIGIDRLTAEEEQAGVERDYERAARKKADRLRMENEFNQQRDKWESEHKLDEVVDVNDIAQVVAQWTGIPVSQMMESEAETLTSYGRTACMNGSLARMKPSRPSRTPSGGPGAGLKDPRRPIGSFIFIGPSGVGKTELAKALAEFMFDDEEALVRLDMS